MVNIYVTSSIEVGKGWQGSKIKKAEMNNFGDLVHAVQKDKYLSHFIHIEYIFV